MAEKIISNKLLHFLSKHKVISDQQYRFQKCKSTEKALINIKKKTIDNTENRMYTQGNLLYIGKIFDSIKH